MRTSGRVVENAAELEDIHGKKVQRDGNMLVKGVRALGVRFRCRLEGWDRCRCACPGRVENVAPRQDIGQEQESIRRSLGAARL